MDYFHLLARFNTWVTEQFYIHIARLGDAEYRRDRDAFFGSIHNTLNHILVVDRLWIGRLNGKDSGISALDQILFNGFEALHKAHADETLLLSDLVDRLTEQDLARVFSYQSLSDGSEHRAKVDQVLVTLFNHQTHHRGQVHCMLTQAGVFPPDLDIVDFLDQAGEPAGT